MLDRVLADGTLNPATPRSSTYGQRGDQVRCPLLTLFTVFQLVTGSKIFEVQNGRTLLEFDS